MSLYTIDPTPLDTLVFLGDYIDRGPDSRGVVEQVIALGERCIVVPLMGNHEEMLLAALEGQSELKYWLKFGGLETLASYGHSGSPDLTPATVRNLIPLEHLNFIRNCRNYYETVTNFFVHAYYEPDRPLIDQSWSSLLAIQEIRKAGLSPDIEACDRIMPWLALEASRRSVNHPRARKASCCPHPSG